MPINCLSEPGRDRQAGAKPKRGRKKNWKDDALQWTTDTGEFDRELTALSRSSEVTPTPHKYPKLGLTTRPFQLEAGGVSHDQRSKKI